MIPGSKERLVVGRVEFVEDQITIKLLIPISDVRLQHDQHCDITPKAAIEIVGWRDCREHACYTTFSLLSSRVDQL
jgi:hypothetical protein